MSFQYTWDSFFGNSCNCYSGYGLNIQNIRLLRLAVLIDMPADKLIELEGTSHIINEDLFWKIKSLCEGKGYSSNYQEYINNVKKSQTPEETKIVLSEVEKNMGTDFAACLFKLLQVNN